MIVLDLILLIPILIGTWLGFRNGFIITITTLLAFIGGTYAGLWFSETVSGFIQSMMSSPHPYVPLISFSICFLAVCALVFFIGKWAQRLSKIVLLGALDKIAGGIFGSNMERTILALHPTYFTCRFPGTFVKRTPQHLTSTERNSRIEVRFIVRNHHSDITQHTFHVDSPIHFGKKPIQWIEIPFGGMQSVGIDNLNALFG
jgi:membrane protein required for colicin V production